MTHIAYLSDTWRWLGEHTGYDVLSQYVGRLDKMTTVTCAPPRFTSRINRLVDAQRVHYRKDWGYYPGSERVFLKQFSAQPEGIGHILYFERHRGMLNHWSRVPKTIVATLHNRPDPVQHPAFYKDLRRLHSAVVLYQRDKEFFEQFVESGKVAFIQHGVDTDFFTPTVAPTKGARRLLYIGINGRDLAMLKEVVRRLEIAEPEVRFDFVVPKSRSVLRALRSHPKITWHHDLADASLRSLYQASYLLLLPLKASGANNAVVEAMACGVPPVTTDIGGIRDYGGSSLYPVVAARDEAAMVDLVRRYLHEVAWRDQVGSKCRAFAEQNLAWPIIARKHLDFYRELQSG